LAVAFPEYKSHHPELSPAATDVHPEWITLASATAGARMTLEPIAVAPARASANRLPELAIGWSLVIEDLSAWW
jgi:hypothetical protein